ncbi:MAG TPA: hypothetical protein VNU26_00780 [Mycobacteriales bacterium]|nr:hypothetical protein [Mycobacteriales bacterium]
MLQPDDARLLDGLDEVAQARHGVPPTWLAARRERAAQRLREVLDRTGVRAAVRTSPLGPAWSGDLDVHGELPPEQALRAAGMVPLAPLHRRLSGRAYRTWAVVEDDTVLGTVDLLGGVPPRPVDAVLARARRRGEVRLREVLELRALAAAGERLPDDPVVRAAAVVEAAHGGAVLAGHDTGEGAHPARHAPAPLPRGRLAPVRRAAARRRRPLVVALSGVDGAGKSTLARHLVDDLTAAGIDAAVVWTRPGMGLGGAAAVARAAKRLLRHGSAPSVRSVAAGEPPPAARRGLPGLAWALLVCASFGLQARRPRLSGRQVLVYDRHLPDALVTLDVFYPGVPTTLPHRLVRLALPRADLACYLDLPADVLRERKPDDLMGAQTVDAQLAAYARRLPALPAVRVVDARQPPQALSGRLVRELLTD